MMKIPISHGSLPRAEPGPVPGVRGGGLSMLAAALCAAAMLATSLPAGPARAADDIDWDNRRDAARAHASAITQAWGVLAAWIEREPNTGDPDLTQARAPHLWEDGTYSTELLKAVYDNTDSDEEVWLENWSGRGLSFRFCDQTLAVFADTELRGTDMATVAVEGGLQLVNGAGTRAEGLPQSGYPDAVIPLCMGRLPPGTVALVSGAIDPFGWNATQRRNTQEDWELGCASPAVGLTGTVGSVRYSQTVPIELHPWSGADMDRWPGPMGDVASCVDRESGDLFDFAWTDADGQSRTRNGVEIPEHGKCNPEGVGGAGNHLVAAAVFDPANVCRTPTEIEGRKASRWHFFDTLCAEAEADGTARDSSVFFDASDYVGTPSPSPLTPTPPACRYVAGGEGASSASGCGCPSAYRHDPYAAAGRKIRKHRMVWKQAGNVVGAGSSSWSEARQRLHPDAGGGPTADCVRQNFADCYKLVTIACTSAEAASVWGIDQSISYSVTQHTGYRAQIARPGSLLGTSGIEGIDWDWGNLPPQTLSGTATVTGSLVKRVYHPHSGGRETIDSNTCTYVTGLSGSDGCNWGGMSEDGTCI